MAHQAKDFSYLKRKVKSLSEKQLEEHFKLYNGYVARINLIEDELAKADKSHTNYSWGNWSELKRREAVAYNGTYLHQYYFENLGNDGTVPSDEFKAAVDEAFGSWDNFLADIKSTALSTIGWVVVSRRKSDRKLHTYLLTEHHGGLPVDQDIVLVIDSYEHAFFLDYGVDRGGYIQALFDDINWEAVNKRFAALQ